MRNKKDLIKGFSNKNRLSLIICLEKPQNVSELLKKCSLSQSALSQHLKILKECNIASCERLGKEQIYSILDKEIINIAKLILKYI
jgi:DNA-binding transcriptional ArsR family regulator